MSYQTSMCLPFTMAWWRKNRASLFIFSHGDLGPVILLFLHFSLFFLCFLDMCFHCLFFSFLWWCCPSPPTYLSLSVTVNGYCGSEDRPPGGTRRLCVFMGASDIRSSTIFSIWHGKIESVRNGNTGEKQPLCMARSLLFFFRLLFISTFLFKVYYFMSPRSRVIFIWDAQHIRCGICYLSMFVRRTVCTSIEKCCLCLHWYVDTLLMADVTNINKFDSHRLFQLVLFRTE